MAADRPADRPSDAASTDASSPMTPTDTRPTTATWPLLDASNTTPTDTPPTTATWPLLEEPALPPAATESRWKRWRAAAASVAGVVVIVLSVIPTDLLLDDDNTADPNPPAITTETAAPDPTAATPDGQLVYWEDLRPGMCVRIPGDPDGMSYIVVDCSAEHEEEVTSATKLVGSEKWPGDDAVDKAAAKKCKSGFASYVGLGIDESRLDLDSWTVGPYDWVDDKVTLICLVLDPSNEHLTRSLRGAHE
jgi:hypothetical protein